MMKDVKGIIVFNTGSSSVKFALYGMDCLNQYLHGTIDEKPEGAVCSFVGDKADEFIDFVPPKNGGHAVMIEALLDGFKTYLPEVNTVAAGHRVVHGGDYFDGPVMVNDDSMAKMEDLIRYAFVHQPHNIQAIKAVKDHFPDLPQVACFDTAFHRTQPQLATMMTIPKEFYARGIKRYGFHGLSYQNVADVLANEEDKGGRVVAAHLGNGASMCAIKNGKSVATTMGMTVLDGLMMGTRSGSVDPGLLLYLINQEGYSPKDIEAMLTKKSGLLGVSGISNDIRDLIAANCDDANIAIDLFAYRAAREIGSLSVALGGLDRVIFTGGIGENAALVRQKIIEYLGFLNVKLDNDKNNSKAEYIHSENSAVKIQIIKADEELVIAKAVKALLG